VRQHRLDAGDPEKQVSGKKKMYLRRHKAMRIKALMLERATTEKAGRQLDRKLGWSIKRTEAAFRGCRSEDDA
jgi:hypothetical protein